VAADEARCVEISARPSIALDFLTEVGIEPEGLTAEDEDLSKQQGKGVPDDGIRRETTPSQARARNRFRRNLALASPRANSIESSP
jgi:hypothetical protein